MCKKIILCLDGTDNQYKEDNSNVLKLYRVIERIQAWLVLVLLI